MTVAEILPILQQWDARHRALNNAIGDACALLGCAIEGPLWEAVIAVANGDTEATAARVGDKEQWLDYWLHECDAGDRPQIVMMEGEAEMILDSLEDLAEIIAS